MTWGTRLFAQSAVAEQYVTLGQSRAYRERQAALESAQGQARRKLARSASLPSVQASVLRTELSGNVIDVGRFLNPAYGTLNQLLGRSAFPTDIALSLPLRSQQFVRFTQPVFAPAAWFGIVAANRAEDAQAAARRASSRDGELEIRLAWLGWHKLGRVLAVYDAGLALLAEQARVSERLVAEGVRTPEMTLRVRAEITSLQQQRNVAEIQRVAAGRQLNLLIARPLDAVIEDDSLEAVRALPSTADALRAARSRRDELTQLDATGQALDATRKAAAAGFLPTLAVAYDYGFQGQDARLQSSREYRQLAVVMQWNVFSGFADRARVEQVARQREGVRVRLDEVTQQIELQVLTAHDAARVARDAITAADEQLGVAERAYEMVRRRSDEGLASPVEMLDARRLLTTAAMFHATSVADYHARRLELMRAAALDVGTQP
jgi:outer membrane protein TolC